MNSQIWRNTFRFAGPVLATAAGTKSQVPLTRSHLEAPAPPPSSSLAHLSPFPPIRVMRPNENLEIAFDVRTRCPVYVLERVVVDAATSSTRHNRPNFYEDSRNLPVVYRSQSQHYHKSGYDRGHMAPAADFAYDKSAYHDTFTLCNTIPQDPTLNKKDWAVLEEWTRNVAKQAHKQNGATTYVVSGPMWLPKRQIGERVFQYAYPALGKPPSLVAVPSHLFKVVIVVKDDKVLKFACFVMSNAEPEPNRNLQDYLVRWTDLEAVTGLQFFPNLVDNDWKQQADRLTGIFVKQLSSLSQQPLLLTDGGKVASSSSSSWRAKRNVALTQHLCDRDACQRP